MVINWLIISELRGPTAGRQLVNDSVFFLWNPGKRRKWDLQQQTRRRLPKAAFFFLEGTSLVSLKFADFTRTEDEKSKTPPWSHLCFKFKETDGRMVWFKTPQNYNYTIQ